MSRPIASLPWLTAASVALLGSSVAHAAALLGAPSTHPTLTVETALIVWQPDTKREHLLLSARVERAQGPVAYVVPTPAEPRVAPVDQDLSTSFAKLIADYRARTPDWELPTLPGGMLRPWLTVGVQGKADSSTFALATGTPLDATLREQGYETDAALGEWLSGCREADPYALVIYDRNASATRTLPWVHVEFDSARPMFPYREPSRPADQVQGSETAGATLRLLRIYVLTTERVAMRLGSSMASMAQAWLSYEPSHEELKRALGGELVAAVGIDNATRYWVTSFEDYHVVRPGNDDAWFDRLGPIPKDGEPGTLGDGTKAGVALSPIGPEPGTVVAEPAVRAEVEGRSPRGPSGQRGGLSRREKTGLVFAGLVGLSIVSWWWLTAKKV